MIVLIKYLYLIQSDFNNNLVSNAINLEKLFNHLDSKQLVFKTISYTDAILKTWDNAEEGILLVHSFSAWPETLWEDFLSNLKSPLFVIPTEFNTNDKLKKAFNHKNICKIIVCTEYYQKYFLKTLNFDSSKIKLIYLASSTFDVNKFKSNLNKGENFVILSPSVMTSDKNYSVLLKVIKKLKLKYRKLIFAFLLKTHPNYTKEQNQEIISHIEEIAKSFNLSSNIRILINVPNPYEDYLKISDVIVIPTKDNNKMYSATIIDALMLNKPIVCPDTKFAFDLCKKDAGIYLYPTEKDLEIKNDKGKKNTKISVLMTEDEIADCIFENCSTVLDNLEVNSIMQEQNSIISNNYSPSKILPQFINLIRRFKSQ